MLLNVNSSGLFLGCGGYGLGRAGGESAFMNGMFWAIYRV